MHNSTLFETIIESVTRNENLEVHTKVYLERALTYFRNQCLCDADRKDSKEKILEAWLEFERTTKGAKALASFRNDVHFWARVESSIGVKRPNPMATPASIRRIKVEDFFRDISKDVSTMDHSTTKLVLMFALWLLESEATKAASFRNRPRCERAYRTIYPVLKRHGLLQKYQNDKNLKRDLQYFLNGQLI
ncbi:hypothetical protein QJS83_17045 [Bdellovibrio sp. 22V]|uniref:hypothetical protein n=1 Tax=Bdellovibrio sp. 22V TaxID=3044166 RepID=UPI0025435786|nr:hypothetical protein [Bdellovibrio sp. 22V]WII72172.1 hypothetical protein QJS83_17045 [Bdellovibrio sp. 22V]